MDQVLIIGSPRSPADARRLLIVRPDGYVGLSTSGTDWAGAKNYLARLVV